MAFLCTNIVSPDGVTAHVLLVNYCQDNQDVIFDLFIIWIRKVQHPVIFREFEI